MKEINWDNELALARVNQTVNRLVTAPYSPGFIPPPSVGEINPSLASQEPSFGRYPANLDFGDTQTALDINQLPTAPRESFREAMRELFHTGEFIFFLAALALFLVVILVKPWLWGW